MIYLSHEFENRKKNIVFFIQIFLAIESNET